MLRLEVNIRKQIQNISDIFNVNLINESDEKFIKKRFNKFLCLKAIKNFVDSAVT